jgi:hypothetical protein
MKFMYVDGDKVVAVEATSAVLALNGWRRAHPHFYDQPVAKPFRPPEERCTSMLYGHPCLNRRKSGTLCGVHEQHRLRDSERQAKHDREQAEADARRDLAYRLAAATGISTPDSPFRYYAYFTMSDDDLLALVEWCERRTG